MAISLGVYSNGNASSKSVSVDFIADYLASSSNGVSSAPKYFFKLSTTAKDMGNNSYEIKVSESLNDLVLAKEKRAITDSAVPYPNIKSMIVDYVYDFIQGHAANAYGTGVFAQLPMKFN